MSDRAGLGEFEQLVLLVVLRLGKGAFAPRIGEVLDETVGRGVTRGALYSTLNRLETKGFLAWVPEEPDAERGGHIRRLFSVTEAGIDVLRGRRETLLTLWDGLEGVLDRGTR